MNYQKIPDFTLFNTLTFTWLKVHETKTSSNFKGGVCENWSFRGGRELATISDHLTSQELNNKKWLYTAVHHGLLSPEPPPGHQTSDILCPEIGDTVNRDSEGRRNRPPTGRFGRSFQL